MNTKSVHTKRGPIALKYLDETDIARPVQFPNASLLVNAVDSIIFCRWLSRSQIGMLWDSISRAAQFGDFEYLSHFDFIERVFVGTAKRPTIPPSVKREVLSAGACIHCGSTDFLEVDHIVPYSKGGPHSKDNFQCLCRTCNRTKSNHLEVA